MKFLTAVINEGLRLYPPAPFLLRTAKGSQETDLLFIPIWAMHRDPEFWARPSEFVPERWLDQEDAKHEIFIPFGLGARVCIGQRFAMIEARVILYEIIRQFWLEPLPGFRTQAKMDILTRPRKNMRVMIMPALVSS
jgi:cytochrome P450